MADAPLTKKQFERWQLDRFAALCPAFPPGHIEETEEPDFLVGNGRLGVELTDLFHETSHDASPLQAQESLRLRVAKAAEDLYQARGGPALHVSIHFNTHCELKKQDVGRLSQLIATWVHKNAPAPGQSFTEEYDWENRDYFPEEVHHLGAWQFPGITRTFFSAPSASFAPKLQAVDIRRALTAKEPKLPRYRLRATEVWLLVNIDIGQLSTYFLLEQEVLNERFETSFDRVFLLRHVGNQLHELHRRPMGA
jgi:hypothetical protein